jgi:hypothetical protein
LRAPALEIPEAPASAATCAIAASSSASSQSAAPAGLSGTTVGGQANAQYAAEDTAGATALAPASGSFLAGKTTVTPLGSTTPVNGDINPYAIWPVTQTVGSVSKGDVLVDNFNNSSNNLAQPGTPD